MTKTNFLHTAFVLVLNSLLISGNIFGAENPSSEEIKKVDSLNSIAFKEKRFAVAKALNDLFVAENIASTAGYQKGLATTFLYQAGIYQQIGYDQRALSVYYKSLQIFKELKDTFHIAFTNQQIASSLQSSGNTDEAIQVYTESLSIFTLLNKQEDIVNSKNSLGLVYTGLQKFDLAESNLNEALRLGKDIGYVYGEKKAYYHLGLLEFRKNNLQAAEIYFRESLAKDRGLHDRYGAALNLLQLAAISLKKEKYDSVIIDALLAYNDAAAISALNLKRDIATQLVNTYHRIGEDRSANQWEDSLVLILQNQLRDEKEYALNFIDVIRAQDTQRINAEREVNNARNIQKKQLVVITIGTSILIIVAVLAVLALVNYQRQRFFGKELKQKNEIIEKNAASLDLLNKEISHQNLLLETDNKTKNKLLSIISHDLRTPLVNTKGILNLVNQEMVPADEAKKLLQQLETQYIGTTSLLDNLLFWIKGQMNGQLDEKVKVGLYTLVKNLEEEHRLPIERKQIHFKNNIDPTLFIMIEKEMMRIVCRNLISNAIKFTNETGFVELNSSIAGNNLFITVEDNGIGMTAEAIEKVNAKVYYNTAGTSYEKGSGFGLMLCRDLIAKHGGELLVKSEPGKGSLFTIKLPYQKPV